MQPKRASPTDIAAATRLTDAQWLKYKQSLLSSLTTYTHASITPLIMLSRDNFTTVPESALWYPFVAPDPVPHL
jgi:hypothetical protein